MNHVLNITTAGKGLQEITPEVVAFINHAQKDQGLCTLFVRHTSASLLIQENADPKVRADLNAFFSRLVPEGDTLYSHDEEGLDDMPAHIRCALTQTSLSIPILNGTLALGRWQGIFLWEHRRASHTRQIVIHIGA